MRGNRIEQALRTKLSQEDRQRLASYMETLPLVDEDGTGDAQAGAAAAGVKPAPEE